MLGGQNQGPWKFINLKAMEGRSGAALSKRRGGAFGEAPVGDAGAAEDSGRQQG